MPANTQKLQSRHSRRSVLKAGAAAGLALPAAGIGASQVAANHPTWSSVNMHLRRQDSITLQATVWLGDAEFEAMNELASHFTEQHPEVTVEFINIIDGGPWGRDQLQRMIAGGEPPDLMMMNTGQFEAFGSRGALANLEERVAAESYDLGIYWPAAVEGCRIGGDLHGLPKDISCHCVYLNTDMFEAAGVELPAEDWTWDDYRETAKALTNGTDQWGTSLQNSVWSWGSFVHTNGGQVLNEERTECMITSEEAREAIRAYYGVMTEDQAAIPPGALPQIEGAQEQFLNGAVAMNMAGPWFRPSLVNSDQFNWTVTLYPRPVDGTAPISVLYTDQWGMSADTENPDMAWELLKFLGGEEGLSLWSDIYGSRSITPVQSLAESDAWLSFGGEEHREDNQTFLNQLDRTVPPPTNFGDGAEVENIWNEEFELAIVGQVDIDTAIDNICTSIDRVLGG